nr:hypothetical protein [Candidatus Njordarchaeota archaeon]
MGKLDPKSLAKRALQDQKTLSELLEGVLSKNDDIRHGSFQALRLVGDERPELLCPKWDFFAELLRSDNAYHRNIAVYIIAALTKVDSQDRFGKLADNYFALLNSESLMNAGHTALNLGKIAEQKPELQERITSMFLNISKTYPKRDRTDNVISYIIEGLNTYFKETDQKQKILEFVSTQLESKSQTTRKRAREFLEKWKK